MVTFGAGSYGVLGALYLLLSVMLLTSWRSRKIGGFLITACVVNACWSGLMAWDVYHGGVSRGLIFFAEILLAVTLATQPFSNCILALAISTCCDMTPTPLASIFSGLLFTRYKIKSRS